MELRQLQTFVAVAELRHFARAADRCNLSQPAVSHQIRLLEEQLGARLLNRDGRRVSLTVAGELFVEDARRILAAVDRARERVQNVSAGTIGRVRIGATETPGLYRLPALLERYRRAIPWLHSGARRGGRDPEAVEVFHFTTCYLGDDRRACLHEAKRMLARYANLPFYGNMLAQTGFGDEVEAVRAAWKAKDVAAAEGAVSDEMAAAVTLVGDPAECRKRIRAYRMAGADRVIVFPNPVGESRAAAVERALEGLRPR